MGVEVSQVSDSRPGAPAVRDKGRKGKARTTGDPSTSLRMTTIFLLVAEFAEDRVVVFAVAVAGGAGGLTLG